jgi:RimJ/RimL family protein N-acetyltransferase
MIKTPRLIIAPLTKSDCADIHYKNSFSEVAAFNTIEIPKNLKVTEDFLQPLFKPQQVENGQQLGWSIRLLKENTFIGELGMRVSSPKYNKGEIHYSLIPAFWNKGYATEAVQAILKHGFETLNLHRIEAGVATQNLKSIKLLEKVGMTREGMHRKILPIRGQWIDNFSYAILVED